MGYNRPNINMGEDEVTRWEREIARKKSFIATLQESLNRYRHTNPSQAASVRSRIAREKSSLEYAKGQLKIAKAKKRK